MTRQQIRAQERADAFRRVNAAYGLEPRRARRGIARAWATQAWRKRAALATVSCGILALLSFGATPSAHAQGSRKDDVVFNAQGRPLAGATVRVCTSAATGQPCSPLALVYSDAALTQALANPLSTDGLGNYSFYAAPGRYMIEVSGPGITTKQLPNVILPSDPSSPTFSTVTTTNGISAFSLSLTGNLTVSGSAAVLGTLTVGGAPLPSTNADNQWEADQRFKGPIPYRDVTSYMPAGGCGNFPAAEIWYHNFTGSIPSGSHTLKLSNASDFINGCGLTVNGAGPTSTLITPSCTPATMVSASNGVTITCAANHNLQWFNSGGANGQDQGVSITGCSNTAYNGIYVMDSSDATTHFTYSTAASGTGSTTGCVVTFFFGWAHGVTGSTTYYYAVSPIDTHGGLAAAVHLAPITNGNATLSTVGVMNFNVIFWPFIGPNTSLADGPTKSARMTAVWRSLDNVNWVCAGIQVAGLSFQDWGMNLPCPDFVPTAPPASATNGQLTTTITAGGGTTSLTLADAASNTATSQYAYHDERPFLTACLNDLNADQVDGSNYPPSGAYCYIPAGGYHFNSDMPTDLRTNLITAANTGLTIMVAGTIHMSQWPWIIGNQFTVKGISNTGAGDNFTNFPSTRTVDGNARARPALFVLNGSNITLDGFSDDNDAGNGVYVGLSPDNLGAVSGVTVNHMVITNSASPAGVPFIVGGNTYNVSLNEATLTPCPNCFPASVLLTIDTFRGVQSPFTSFKNVNLQWHHYFVNTPGGEDAGSGMGISITGGISEEHGQFATGGLVTCDIEGEHSALVTDGRNGVHICGIGQSGFLPADDSNHVLIALWGGYGNGQAIEVAANSSAAYLPFVQCLGPDGPNPCNQNLVTGIITSGGDPGSGLVGGVPNVYEGELYPGGVYGILEGLVVGGNGFPYNGIPPHPMFATALRSPGGISITGTSSGSLAAGRYCMELVALDAQSTAGTTLPGPETCQTVGASSSIGLSWATYGAAGYPYANFQLWWGTGGPGSENQYILTNNGGTLSPSFTFTFTSTAGATGGVPPTYPSAYMGWLYADYQKPSCLLCLPAGGVNWPLGIGEPSPPAGDKVAVKGGVLDAESGFKSALATKTTNYTLTTSDYWINVTGTTTITAPHATTGNHWVVFNSGSNTVTVQADSGNINGGANIALSANTGKEIACDGTNCFAH